MNRRQMLAAAAALPCAYDPDMGPGTMIDGIYAQNYAGLPNKTLKRIDGGYHYIMLDQPDAFAREVAAFLA